MQLVKRPRASCRPSSSHAIGLRLTVYIVESTHTPQQRRRAFDRQGDFVVAGDVDGIDIGLVTEARKPLEGILRDAKRLESRSRC